jgi:hypothetical protein
MPTLPFASPDTDLRHLESDRHDDDIFCSIKDVQQRRHRFTLSIDLNRPKSFRAQASHRFRERARCDLALSELSRRAAVLVSFDLIH